MNNLKTAFYVVVLLGVLGGAYVAINDPSILPWNRPDAELPPDVAEQDRWVQEQMNGAASSFGPNVSLGTPQEPGAPQGPGAMVSLGTPAASLGGTAPAQPSTGPRAAVPPPIASVATRQPNAPPRAPDCPHAVDPATGRPLDVSALGSAAPGAGVQGTGVPGAGRPIAARPEVTPAHPAHDSHSHASASTVVDGVQFARPDDNTAFLKAWQSAQQQLERNMLADALFTLSAWHDHPAVPESFRSPVIRLLDQLAGSVIYAPDSFDEPALAHRVARGETLDSIAGQYNVPAGLLARINGIDGPADLIPTRKIKAVRGPFRAELSLSRREMTLYVGRYYAGRFPVSVGNDLPNVEAIYEVAEKTRGRIYFDPRSGTEIPVNHPDNPYGAYWLGLRGVESPGVGNIGLHGTASTQDGRDDPRGSAGLSPRGADDVFAILTLRSKVAVRR